ncbi:hypothetical protein PENSPDRAFT_664388 [Peniophora sp. CONT]|nr:hypothetical protein PENSPDRAFT_664388 [Peniophora sp. CONT]
MVDACLILLRAARGPAIGDSNDLTLALIAFGPSPALLVNSEGVPQLLHNHSLDPASNFTNVMGYSPPPSSPEHEDPGLMATFGPLRVLNSTTPKKHVIGRAPDCDFVVTGEYAHLTSRHHCELIWDGLQTSIVDLQSMNGTWVGPSCKVKASAFTDVSQVNSRRLADGEVLLLRDKDIVSFSALPFDRRPNRDRTGRSFYGCTLGQINAIQFMYLEYTLETLTDKLSSTGYAIRQSMDALLRIRTVIRSVSRPTENKLLYPAPRLSDASTPLYRGPLNRPDRPETSVYAPPLPLDDTPDLLDDLPNSRNWPGPEDPDGLPADHPDLIWSKDVRYNCTPSSHLPPLEMRQWSHCFGLPIGLHTYWPIISSTAYGTRDRDVSPDAIRDLAYYIRRIRPDWPVLDVSTPEYIARNPHAFMVDWQPVCASEDPCAEHGLALSEGSLVLETASNITPVTSPASPSLAPFKSATRNADASDITLYEMESDEEKSKEEDVDRGESRLVVEQAWGYACMRFGMVRRSFGPILRVHRAKSILFPRSSKLLRASIIALSALSDSVVSQSYRYNHFSWKHGRHTERLFLDISLLADSALVLRLVCRHWRAVAEATPELWLSFVTDHGLAWTRRAIAWTKNLPLNIKLHPISPLFATKDKRTQEVAVLAELPRIRHLTYRFRNAQVAPQIHGSAHELEMFNLFNGDDRQNLMTLSDHFFRVTSPRLTHVALSSASLSKNCLLLKAPLTHLELRTCVLWDTVKDLLRTFSTLPQLESFIWSRDVDDYVDSAINIKLRKEPLEMANLSHFEMDHAVDVILAVMKHIILPPSCNIELIAEVDEEYDDPDAFLESLDDVFVRHLASVFPRSGSASFVGFQELSILDLEDEDDVGFTARWGGPLVTPEDPASSAGLEITLLFPVDESIGEVAEILIHMFRRWPGTASSITRLTVDHHDFFEDDRTWRTVFTCLKYLVDLDVEGLALRTLPQAFRQDDELRILSLSQLTVRGAMVSISEYQLYISEMERRRVLPPLMDRCPRTITFIDCTIVNQKLFSSDEMEERATWWIMAEAVRAPDAVVCARDSSAAVAWRGYAPILVFTHDQARADGALGLEELKRVTLRRPKRYQETTSTTKN